MSTLLEQAGAFAAAASRRPLPPAVEDQARRALINWLAAAVQGSQSAEGRCFLRLAAELGKGPALLVGSPAVAAAPAAAWINGANAHVDDYDDTHLSTVAHPATPVIAALLAGIDPHTPWSSLLTGVAVGCETLIHTALALHPAHYDAGWHVTASAGGVGAALGLSASWGLDGAQSAHAAALAALQPVGLRVAFGTMGKSYQVGRAAAVGLTSALAARAGVTGPLNALEHPRGLRIATTSFHPEAMQFAGEGEAAFQEFLCDTFKPYPCGIVTHPLIDAGRALHERGIRPSAMAGATARVHPLVLELTNQDPPSGLAVKFSARYLFVLALERGQVRPADFADLDAHRLAQLRPWAERVRLVAEPDMGRDAAEVVLRTRDGEIAREAIAHARGSLARPLGWEDLHDKWRAAAGEGPAAARIWELVRGAGGGEAVEPLLRALSNLATELAA